MIVFKYNCFGQHFILWPISSQIYTYSSSTSSSGGGFGTITTTATTTTTTTTRPFKGTGTVQRVAGAVQFQTISAPQEVYSPTDIANHRSYAKPNLNHLCPTRCPYFNTFHNF